MGGGPPQKKKMGGGQAIFIANVLVDKLASRNSLLLWINHFHTC